MTLNVTGDAEADRLVSTDPLALLIGMLLDQQIPIEWAFRGPWELKRRLGGTLDATAIAGMSPDALRAVFTERPAIHRFPRSMADRVQALCRAIVEDYDGDAARVWEAAADGPRLFANLRALPGYGEQKARIFVAILAKRLAVRPEGWEECAGRYGTPGYWSVADVDGPDSLARVRQHKREMKAAAAAAKATTPS